MVELQDDAVTPEAPASSSVGESPAVCAESERGSAAVAADASSARHARAARAVLDDDDSVRVSCEVARADLLHCRVRPRRSPPGKLFKLPVPERPAESSNGGVPAVAAAVEASEMAGGAGETSRTAAVTNTSELENFSYQLDEYQRIAGEALFASESVIVSAPTSSGKTTVAILALNSALRYEDSFAVFCAPIKALSNQMFCEFHKKFPGKVGLLTGDHNIAPRSPILVVTTEIFRCLLHTDPEFVKRLRVAIFDEVHYLSDLERGPAWEESIVLLPPGVSFVFLSATMANPIFLAGWLCRLKHRTVHAIQKRGRPVPLRHFAYPIGSDPKNLSEVLDASGKVYQVRIDTAARQVAEWHKKWQRDQDAKAARQAEEKAEREAKGWKDVVTKESARKQQRQKRSLLDKERVRSLGALLRVLVEDGTKPVLVFCFSKGECDALARPLVSSGRISIGDRADEIRRIIKHEMRHIPEEDRNSENVRWLTEDFLPRGIGLHHGGLIPTVREITELLFKRNLLEVLLCTETFGMGLNMPARVVVFHFRADKPLTKFDGFGQRVLTPTEYLQMSGRAGRRMMDAHGTSILTLDDPFKPEELGSMLGQQKPVIQSRYEMQASSALRLLKHGRCFLDWFGRQTLLQFESRGVAGAVLQEPIDALARAMQDHRIGLINPEDSRLTDHGRACCVIECGDVLLVGRLIAEGCFDGFEVWDLLAYFTVFVIERGRSGGDQDDEVALPAQLVRLAERCEKEAQIVDDVIKEAGLQRQVDDAGSLCERLRARRYLVEIFRQTWLSDSSFDTLVFHSWKHTDAGALIRVIRRVEEFTRQVAEASHRLGKTEFSESLKAGMKKYLHRGLPFCESLYFPDELRGMSEEGLDRYFKDEWADDNMWSAPCEYGDTLELDPATVCFTQSSISDCFSDGTPLRRKLHMLLRNEESVTSLSKSLKVVFYRGEPYALGNRRLAVLRMYSWLVDSPVPLKLPFKIHHPKAAWHWGWDWKFSTGSFRGARTVIRTTGEVVGVSPYDSLCSVGEEAEEEEEKDVACGFWEQYDLLPESVREPTSIDRDDAEETPSDAGEGVGGIDSYNVAASSTGGYDGAAANGPGNVESNSLEPAEAAPLAGDADGGREGDAAGSGRSGNRGGGHSCRSGGRGASRGRGGGGRGSWRPVETSNRRQETIASAIAYCETIVRQASASGGSKKGKKKAASIKHAPNVVALFCDLDMLPPNSADSAQELLEMLPTLAASLAAN
eukprot:TRINITY_DN8485_c0_g2_i1.p1 TRINITY_DN8485_c0_g2~~TRINITY_DN8485_c0_g2_i1.p1  ORF type:complete len:1244 (-),score=253.96 TRINITY_DN8485_c0_g2_i1:53-3784(-)